MIDRRFVSFGGLAALSSGLAGCTGSSMMPDFVSRTATPAATDPSPTQTIRPPSDPIGSRTLSKPNYAAVYGDYPGERFPIMAFDHAEMDPVFLRQSVEFRGPQQPGSIVIDPRSRHLYYIEQPGVATRYGVGVGREGFLWSGEAKIQYKRDWPDWVPPREMIERQPEIREKLEPIANRGLGVPGGPKSPLGARAMYLWDNTHDLGYRIHGTTEPDTIGSNVSSGCIRMINQDIAHLYARVSQGTPVTVMG
jgi:lipoprotein-anchoring transpeptidase ErfK/SrfK